MVKILHLTKTDYKSGIDRRIEQGSLFDWLTLKYPGDVSNYLPSGQVRKNYADKLNSNILANFSFPNLYYNAEINKTIIIPKIIPSETLKIITLPSIRKNINDTVLEGQNVWVYDIKIEHPTDQEKKFIILRGYVEVILEVTRID